LAGISRWQRRQNNLPFLLLLLLLLLHLRQEDMESTPLREDPLPSYLENTKSTAYRWHQDMTDSTAHPSIDDTTTHDEITKGSRVKLAKLTQTTKLRDLIV
jgi:hypothetical protein